MQLTQTIDHYLRLYGQLDPAGVGEAVEVGVEQLASALYCTPRNAQLTLKKMVSLRWITWVPGRGRGRRSLLTFRVEPSELLFGLAKELVQKGNVREATVFVEEYGAEEAMLKERFHNWLKSQFGVHREGQGQRRLDTLRMYKLKPLTVLDPAHVSIRSENHMVKQLFDCLVRYNRKTAQIEPHLAYFWEPGDVPTEWTFYLRKGVMFHHGRTMTAADVVYTIERMKKSEVNSPFRWMVENIKCMHTVDDFTLHVSLHERDDLFLHVLSNERLSILPADYCEELQGDFTRVPVGTGPFKVIRNDESMLILEAFEPYFRERAFLDRIEFWILPHWEVEELSGSMQEESQATSITAVTEWNVQMLTFNLNKPGPQANRCFREAVDLLLDQHRMIAELGGPRQASGRGMLPWTKERYWRRARGDQEARVGELLQQSGYRGETLHLYSFDDADHVEDGEWIRKRCAEFGIAIALHFCTVPELLQEERIQQADLILDGTTVDDHLEISMMDLFLSANSFVAHHLGVELGAEVRHFIKQMRQEQDKQVREEVLETLERHLLEQFAFVGLYHNRIQMVSSQELQGIRLNAQGWMEYRELWCKHTQRDSTLFSFPL